MPVTTYEAVYGRHTNTWNHLPQEYCEMVHSSVRDDLANHVLKLKGLSAPVPVVDVWVLQIDGFHVAFFLVSS